MLHVSPCVADHFRPGNLWLLQSLGCQEYTCLIAACFMDELCNFHWIQKWIQKGEFLAHDKTVQDSDMSSIHAACHYHSEVAVPFG